MVASQGDRLYSLGLRFCGNHEEAEDLVQETFLQAWRHWADFKGASSPATWLYTIASRVCQRLHRKRSGEPDNLLSLDAPIGGDPDGASMSDLLPATSGALIDGAVSVNDGGLWTGASTSGGALKGGPMSVVPAAGDPLAEEIRAESRAAVQVAITELPLDFRMPLVLKEIAGFSLRDIAQIMGIPAATVKTRLHRARLRLRDALETALPKRDVPPPEFSRQVCLDLLHAKLDSMDRGTGFQFPGEIVCARCSEFFATLDLAQDVCLDIAAGQMPAALRAQLLAGDK